MSADLPDLIAGSLGVSRGTAYDMMREALAGIAGHLRGPEKMQSETNSQAHARWAWGVASAMMEKKGGGKW